MKEIQPNVYVLDHPLIQEKLTYVRQKETSNVSFRRLVTEISSLMVYEISRDFDLIERQVETPMEVTTCKVLAKNITLVPILRAGLGMLEGILNLIPHARVGHLGLYRNEETLEPVEYYSKFPTDMATSHTILCDPMLATGGSADAALTLLKRKGVPVDRMLFLCLISSPEGVKNLRERHPQIRIYTASVDRCLNKVGYILPGLGDAGDRLYGTE